MTTPFPLSPSYRFGNPNPPEPAPRPTWRMRLFAVLPERIKDAIAARYFSRLEIPEMTYEEGIDL